MQSSEFKPYFEKFPLLSKAFKGTFSIDTLPKQMRNKSFLICNTDKSDQSGQHWFIVFKSDSKTIEVFDSLGFGVEKQDSIKTYWNMKNISELYFNETVFQEKTSNLCGKYCVYFICERLSNLDLDLEDLLSSIFTQNCSENDKIVDEFCSNLLNV